MYMKLAQRREQVAGQETRMYMPPNRYTGVEEGYIEEEKAGEKVWARKKGFGSGQGKEYIRVVFMSLGRWSWKGATREWSENIFCWIKLRSVLFPLCLSDLN